MKVKLAQRTPAEDRSYIKGFAKGVEAAAANMRVAKITAESLKKCLKINDVVDSSWHNIKEQAQ